ncbi:MAG TPA: glycosyltransferase family 4 protein [Mucilaginibacter sp.]|jgi:glycosyltransferase involved in cell wall biosynthesis|nr:glycosyltransferase family 4 protein [Mucilaginibacter sp.]
MKKLAIITTHPIQYYAPVFQLLHQRQQLNIKVFYTWGEGVLNKYDPGFKKNIEWDIPLLNGYPYAWVKNTSKDAGSHHFEGIVNPELIEQINAWHADAILVYGWGYHSHLKALRYYQNKIPVFFRGDSTLLDEQNGLKALLKTVFLKWIYKHIDHAFYVGANNRAYFKKYGLKDDQLSFVPHAVDNNRFAEERKNEVILLKNQLGINDSECVVLFAGKLEEKKAPKLLFEAFVSLNRSDVHLLFVGNGPLEEQLKYMANGKPNVHFVDFQNQSRMPVMYQVCDLFCLPSGGPNETWGLAVNEAMACARAILVSDKVGCAADLVAGGLNGEVFKAGNLKALTEKLQQLTKDKSLLLEYGKQSQLIIADWNFTNAAKAMEKKILHETY